MRLAGLVRCRSSAIVNSVEVKSIFSCCILRRKVRKSRAGSVCRDVKRAALAQKKNC